MCVCVSRGEPIMLKNVPIMLCTYYAQHLCLLCFFFNYGHQNIHNNSNFAMISVIQLVIINIINFILLIFLNLTIKYY